MPYETELHKRCPTMKQFKCDKEGCNVYLHINCILTANLVSDRENDDNIDNMSFNTIQNTQSKINLKKFEIKKNILDNLKDLQK